MSSPMIWIIFPAVVSVAGFLFRQRKTAVTISLTLITILLALFAFWIPIGEIQTVGQWTFTITDRLVFFGRQFVLENTDRSMLLVIYSSVAFFFFGSQSAKTSTFFVPLGLAMSAILVASLSVRPFLYAALFIEIAVLIGVPLLSPPGKEIDRGVMRYFTFLSFGFPFMLIGGGLLSSNIFSETNLDDFLPALVILGFGFAFLLAIFPLNNWIPVLLERNHPYASVFVLSVLPAIVVRLLFRFTQQYPWLLDFEIIQLLGVLMIITGGLWAAFQNDLGRLLGYAVIISIGYSVLVVSQPNGMPLYISMLFPQILAFGVWALSLSLVRKRLDNLRFNTVLGLGRRNLVVVLGILVAHFSLAGFPLLASFPVLMAIWGQLAQSSSLVASLAFLGNIGLLIGALRTLAIFVMGTDDMDQNDYSINRVTQLILLLGIISIVMAGLFPQWFFIIISAIVVY